MEQENGTLAEALPSLSTFPCLALNNTGQKRELETDQQDIEKIDPKKQKQDHSANTSMQIENINMLSLDRNMFDDALVGQGYEAPADFNEDLSRNRVLQGIIDNAPPEDRLQVKADVRTFVKASRALGKAYAKPVDGGTWKVRGMNVSLLSHQVTGAGRGREIENNGDGVLLTDQMGLGKTITVLAVIAATRLPLDEEVRATLIVVQPNVFEQWRREIKRRCLVVGPKDPACGVGRIVCWHGKDTREDHMDPLHVLQEADIVLTTTTELRDSFKEGKSGCLHQARYFRIVVDEAHGLRNRDTTLFKAACAIDADHHWAITGTPMVNNAHDIFSLLVFLGNNMGKSLAEFDEALKHGDTVDLLGTCQDCIVGRTYATPFFGKRLVELPPMVRNEVVFAPKGLEKAVNDWIDAKYAPDTSQTSGSGKGSSGKARQSGLLNPSRQIVSHPVLLPQNTFCESLLESNLVLNPNHYQDESDKTYARYCKKLVDAFSKQNKMKKKAAKSASGKDGASPECVFCEQPALTPQTINPCRHVYCEQCLVDECEKYESANLSHCCKLCRVVIDGYEEYIEGQGDPKKTSKAASGKGNIKDWKDRYGKIYRTAKIICLVDTIKSILVNRPHEKIILFMQYHQLGDVLVEVCKEERWGYVRYNGSQSLKNKQKAINDFQDEKKRKTIFIGSMNAGGVGLNLTVASVVILVEHW